MARARSLTSLATTAKPLPASPARADSIVALRASRFVWSATPLISLMTFSMSELLTSSLVMMRLVLPATSTAVEATRAASHALDEIWAMLAVSSSVAVAAVCTFSFTDSERSATSEAWCEVASAEVDIRFDVAVSCFGCGGQHLGVVGDGGDALLLGLGGLVEADTDAAELVVARDLDAGGEVTGRESAEGGVDRVERLHDRADDARGDQQRDDDGDHKEADEHHGPARHRCLDLADDAGHAGVGHDVHLLEGLDGRLGGRVVVERERVSVGSNLPRLLLELRLAGVVERPAEHGQVHRAVLGQPGLVRLAREIGVVERRGQRLRPALGLVQAGDRDPGGQDPDGQ